uniref:Protein KRI1 homolog n=1 Tax=Stomoxys calcitrans TaxID=35570 RepID=A0A1I8PYP8_STOCA
MSKQLFDESDDNSEKGFQINTNESYAKTYNHLRKKELLQKFKAKGLEASDSESSSEESSEEDEILDPTFDQEFLSTLASLKSKNPIIYDKKVKFFEKVNNDPDNKSDEKDESVIEPNWKKKERKAKPVTLKDYERKVILEKGGKFVDDSDEEDENKSRFNRSGSPSMAEEERRLKAEFQKVMNDEDSGDEEFGGIFKKREKSKVERDAEQEDYLQWLAGKKETIKEDAKEKLKPLKNYWSNDKLPSSEKFLRDYVLNKGYTEAENYADIPTYEEIVGDNAPLSEDEVELEKQAEFEQKYNFRFEDPDQEFIKRYPRTIESSVRRTEEKRKQKRQELKERKQQEKQEKMKELEMVKEMKHKEIQEKIEKLKTVTGNDQLGFKDDDLEEDFDPEVHDRRMRELFNDEYYEVDEGEEKPECPSDMEELKVEDWDNYDPQQDWHDDVQWDYEPHCEDEDFVMDCDYDPNKAKEELQKELIGNTITRKGRKGRRDRFMAMIKSEKPVFDPEDEKTYGEYIDEYYQLDCEDIIGDLPCRFKYVETTPNDFGLTIEEILLAKNKELNQWASLKKATQIRPDHVEKKEQRLYKLKAKNEELKRKIFKSLYGEGSDNENEDEIVESVAEEKGEANTENNKTNELGETKKAKKRRKRKAQNALVGANSPADKITATTACDDPKEESVAKKTKMEEHSEKSEEAIKSAVETEASKKKRKNKEKKKSQHEDKVANDGNIPNGNSQKSEKQPSNSQKPHPAAYENRTPSKSNNPFAKSDKKTQNSFTQHKPSPKSNPFSQSHGTKFESRSLPPLRQNHSAKSKTFNKKFKPKIGGSKKPFNNKRICSTGENGKNISDERLKAYGINPKKFHNKQMYGAKNKQQNQD